MFALLKIILIFTLIIILLMGATAFKFYRSVRDAMRKAGLNGSNRRSAPHRQSPGKEEVIDRRSPKESTRKIIPKDEGEYVDFTEV